ncbi:LolA family protein [Sphingobium nicotianae]|uniref:Outer membrane lipoprotein carrier protein LolA n=1 Tax=Sphingobium nicotianae TaxID=2782607 RepID=A0A9X1IQ59_9SPHN|nr:outer membrane lipoprotein carrier protein LolA [Sphingobium nicotianae]MBT2186449.1 outer membrane lipoprotein carrier protein LolA [Sphingobium nicotianae]
MTRRHQRFTRALILGATLALPIAGIAPVASAQAQTTDDLSAVNRAIRALSTLSGNFTQTDARGQVQSGKLLLKQPGQIRFDYGAGDLLIVADGKSLYMVDYQVGQVQRWPIRNSPLGALLDPTRDLAKYGKLAPTGDPRVVSVEVRDPGHPEYGVISLIFMRKPGAPAGLELYGWVAKDAQGNRTSIRLTNLSYGSAIADSAFKWRDPRPNRGVGPR